MLATYFHNLVFPTMHHNQLTIGQQQQLQLQHCEAPAAHVHYCDNDLNDMMQEVLQQVNNSCATTATTFPLSTPISLNLLQQVVDQQSATTTPTSTTPAASPIMHVHSSNSNSPITPNTSFVQISSNSATALTEEQVEQSDSQTQNYQLEDLAIIRLRPAKKKYGIANLTWNNFDIPELHSGTYRYILQLDMSKHCANIVATQEKFAFALLVEGSQQQQSTGDDQQQDDQGSLDGWQKVNDKYGGNGLKEMSFAQFVNGLPNVLEFSLKFSVNSHEFKKKPFKFQVYFMGALIFESFPFKLVAHKDKRNDIFNKDTYGKKNVAKRAYTKKQEAAAAAEEGTKKKGTGKKQTRQQLEQASAADEHSGSKKRKMSSSSSGSSSEDEHEGDVSSPKSALSAASFALTLPMQFILNNPILRQACEQHAGSNNM